MSDHDLVSARLGYHDCTDANYGGNITKLKFVTELLRRTLLITFSAVSLMLKIRSYRQRLFSKTTKNSPQLQVLFGCATAAEVAYYSYIYAKVPVAQYNKVTSYTRTATLIGRLKTNYSSVTYTNYLRYVHCLQFHLRPPQTIQYNRKKAVFRGLEIRKFAVILTKFLLITYCSSTVSPFYSRSTNATVYI